MTCVLPFPDAPVFAFDPTAVAGTVCAAALVEVAARGALVVPDIAVSRSIDVTRARVGVGAASGPFWARLRGNAARSADADSYIGIAGEAWVPVLDHAAVGGTAFGVMAELGIVPDPWVLAGNRAWSHDALVPTAAEALGLMAPSDAGLSLRWTGLGGRLDVVGTLVTGEGANFRERNEGKDAAGALSFAPFGDSSLIVSVYGRNGSRGLGYVPAHRAGARVAGQLGGQAYGLEGMQAWGVGDDATRAPTVGSAWWTGRIVGPIVTTARADVWSEDILRSDARALRLIGGAGVAVPVDGGTFTALIGADHAAAGQAVAPFAGAAATTNATTLYLQAGLELGVTSENR